MLGSIRKFSGSIYSKILLAIIIIPFVFWGMGSSIRGGSKNIVVVIGKEKHSIQEFSNFITRTAVKKVEPNQIKDFLSAFIGEKLIEKEIEHFKIRLSDTSLRKLIRHQKVFKRGDKFSRTEYEKFLLKSNMPAVDFETILSKQEKKKQVLDFISGGISPSKFLVNMSYDKINQKRAIELINLNDVFKKQLNFSENQIKIYFESNKDKYTEIYKSVKLLELNPKKIGGDDEFSDLFFKKIDEIDDLIIRGENLNYIIQKFNLEKPNLLTINEFGKDNNSKTIEGISKNLVKKIFNLDDGEPMVLIEDNNKYFIAELHKTENIQKNIKDEFIKKEIILDLSKKTKIKLTDEIADKIDKNNFNKLDFDKLSKNENINIKKINLKSRNDNELLKKIVVNHIYKFPEKKIIIVHDINFSENYLVFIDKIENVTIDENSNEYQKYLDLSRSIIVKELYNTYDNYLSKKYKIDINYQTLDVIKNYFN
jgi:peptidyl-prolyl cis-trans isomerase D